MQGIEILPNSMLKNDNMLQIVKALHEPINYVERYNLAVLDVIKQQGHIPKDMLLSKNVIKNLWESKDKESNLMILQNRFIYEIEITHSEIHFRVLHDEIDKVMDIYKKYIPRVKFGKEKRDYKLHITPHTEVVEMVNKEHFLMALDIKDKGLEPLKYIMDIKRQLRDGEKFIYQVILHPLDNDWTVICNKAYNQFKNGDYPEKFKLSFFKAFQVMGDMGLNTLLEFVYIFEELLFGEGNVERLDMTKDRVSTIRRDNGLSTATKDKSKENGFEVSIRGIVESPSQSRREDILSHFVNCFSCLDGDNRLVKHKVKLTKDNKKRIVNRELFFKPTTSGKMILNTREVECLLYLPQITLQKEFGINKFDFYEVDVPKEVTQGGIPMGTIYGSNVMAYWSMKKDVLTLSKAIVGVKGSGKSKYFENYVYHAYKSGDCVIWFDYVENNQNAWEVSKHIPKEDVTIVDLSRGFTFNYPELDISTIPRDEDYNRTLKRFASEYCRLLEKFINTINSEDAQELTSNMRNILTSACSLCFMTQNVDLYSIYRILTNHKFRMECIKKVKAMKIYQDDDFRFSTLESLNEKSGGKVTGTNNKADRVLDRFQALTRDSRTEEMLLGIDRNVINFVEEFEKNKVILILMPEEYFSDYELKDMVVTYFLTRMWLSGLKRAKLIPDRDERKVVHIMLDEIHQLTNATKVMLKNIAEDRKFRTTYVFACQYLKQFGNLWGAVKGTGCNYMLFSGTEKENFLMLKEEIGDKFTLDELINMPTRHSLNIYRYNGQNIVSFLSKLPDMLDVTMRRNMREEERANRVDLKADSSERDNVKESYLKSNIEAKNRVYKANTESFSSKYLDYLKKYGQK